MKSVRLTQFLSTLLVSVSKTEVSRSVLDYVYDGSTTFCYWLNQGLQVENPDQSYIHENGVNEQCPLLVSITPLDAGAPSCGAVVTYQIQVKLNMQNQFGLKELATVRDPFTGRPVEIAHANVHICAHTTACDLFESGLIRKTTTQETANFTNGEAFFQQSLIFDTAGDYTVLAHVIIPSKHIAEERYDVLAFTTANVLPINSKSSSLSTGAVVGIVMGCLVLAVIAVTGIMYYRRQIALKRRAAAIHIESALAHQGTNKISHTKQNKLGWNATEAVRANDKFNDMSLLRDYGVSNVAIAGLPNNLSFHMSEDTDIFNRSRRSSLGSSNYIAFGHLHSSPSEDIHKESAQPTQPKNRSLQSLDQNATNTEVLFPPYPGRYGMETLCSVTNAARDRSHSDLSISGLTASIKKKDNAM